MADISSLVQESLSVSGILLGKTMGRSAALADRFDGESARLAELEVRSRMAGRWTMASVQTSFAIMPALVYLFAGRGLDRHGGGLHHAPDAAVLPGLLAAQRGGRRPDVDRAVRPGVRVPRPGGGHPSGDSGAGLGGRRTALRGC